jgi:hypothetical protein
MLTGKLALPFRHWLMSTPTLKALCTVLHGTFLYFHIMRRGVSRT